MSTKIEHDAPYTRAETCTTLECTAPRIRTNALKCTAHEIVYRANAKIRANERKIAAAAAANVATKTRRRVAKTNVVANVDANGLRTTRPVVSKIA